MAAQINPRQSSSSVIGCEAVDYVSDTLRSVGIGLFVGHISDICIEHDVLRTIKGVFWPVDTARCNHSKSAQYQEYNTDISEKKTMVELTTSRIIRVEVNDEARPHS